MSARRLERERAAAAGPVVIERREEYHAQTGRGAVLEDATYCKAKLDTKWLNKRLSLDTPLALRRVDKSPSKVREEPAPVARAEAPLHRCDAGRPSTNAATSGSQAVTPVNSIVGRPETASTSSGTVHRRGVRGGRREHRGRRGLNAPITVNFVKKTNMQRLNAAVRKDRMHHAVKAYQHGRIRSDNISRRKLVERAAERMKKVRRTRGAGIESEAALHDPTVYNRKSADWKRKKVEAEQNVGLLNAQNGTRAKTLKGAKGVAKRLKKNTFAKLLFEEEPSIAALERRKKHEGLEGYLDAFRSWRFAWMVEIFGLSARTNPAVGPYLDSDYLNADMDVDSSYFKRMRYLAREDAVARYGDVSRTALPIFTTLQTYLPDPVVRARPMTFDSWFAYLRRTLKGDMSAKKKGALVKLLLMHDIELNPGPKNGKGKKNMRPGKKDKRQAAKQQGREMRKNEKASAQQHAARRKADMFPEAHGDSRGASAANQSKPVASAPNKGASSDGPVVVIIPDGDAPRKIDAAQRLADLGHLGNLGGSKSAQLLAAAAADDADRRAAEVDALVDKRIEKLEGLVDDLEAANLQKSEALEDVQRMLDDNEDKLEEARRMGFVPDESEVVRVYTFHGKFDGLNSSFNKGQPGAGGADPLVTVYVTDKNEWISTADGVTLRVHIPRPFVDVASHSVSSSDMTHRMTNIYNGLQTSKEVRAYMEKQGYSQTLEMTRQCMYIAFLLTGLITASGRCRWTNDCAEWIVDKYTVEPPPDWRKRLKHVNFASDTLKFQSQTCRNSRAAPYILDGVIPHVPDAADIGTLIAGLCKRLYPELPQRRKFMLRRIREVSDELADYILAHTEDEDDPTDKELFQHAMEGRPKYEVEQIKVGWDRAKEDPEEALEYYLTHPYKCFIKLESYPDGTFKPPRFIMSLPLDCRGIQMFFMLKVLHLVEVGTRPCNVKGLTADQITEKLRRKFETCDLVAETDFSSFESCIGPDLKRVCENLVYRRLASSLPRSRDIELFIERALDREEVCLVGPVFTDPHFHHIRMSGDLWTSLGNLITNVVIQTVINETTIADMVNIGLFEGDDGAYPAPLHPERVCARAEKCGVKLTFDIAKWESLSFCGNHFEMVDGKLRRFRDPLKVAANLSILFNAPRDTLKHDRMLQRSKHIAYLDGPIVPDAFVFSAVVERFTRDARVSETKLLSMGLLKKYAGYSLESCVPDYLVNDSCGNPLTDEQFCQVVFDRNRHAGGKCTLQRIREMVAVASDAGVTAHCKLPSPIEVAKPGCFYARDGSRFTHVSKNPGLPGIWDHAFYNDVQTRGVIKRLSQVPRARMGKVEITHSSKETRAVEVDYFAWILPLFTKLWWLLAIIAAAWCVNDVIVQPTWNTISPYCHLPNWTVPSWSIPSLSLGALRYANETSNYVPIIPFHKLFAHADALRGYVNESWHGLAGDRVRDVPNVLLAHVLELKNSANHAADDLAYATSDYFSSLADSILEMSPRIDKRTGRRIAEKLVNLPRDARTMASAVRDDLLFERVPYLTQHKRTIEKFAREVSVKATKAKKSFIRAANRLSDDAAEVYRQTVLPVDQVLGTKLSGDSWYYRINRHPTVKALMTHGGLLLFNLSVFEFVFYWMMNVIRRRALVRAMIIGGLTLAFVTFTY